MLDHGSFQMTSCGFLHAFYVINSNLIVCDSQCTLLPQVPVNLHIILYSYDLLRLAGKKLSLISTCLRNSSDFYNYMSWLRNLQGQLSELASEVLSEATDEVADPESELQASVCFIELVY